MKWFSKEMKLARALRSSAHKARKLWLDDDLLRFGTVAAMKLESAEKADALALRLEQGLITYQYALEQFAGLTK